MKRHKNFPWELLPWGVVVLSLVNMWRITIMDFSNIPDAIFAAAATLGAALIAGTVALIGQGRQLKRDGKTIDQIHSTTKATEPKIDNIEKSCNTQNEKLNSLVMDLEHRKRMEAMFPQSASAMSMISSGVDKLRDENLALKLQYENALTELESLKRENIRLRKRIDDLSRNTIRKVKSRDDYEPSL